MQNLNRIPQKTPAALSTVVDNEAVIINAPQGKVTVLNAVATFIWEQIDGSRTLAQLGAQVCAEFDVDPATAAQDVENFIASLTERGILTLEN